MNIEQANEWREVVFDTLEVPEFWKSIVPIEWNNRLRTTLGRAHKSGNIAIGVKYKIQLSVKAFALMSEEEQEITVVHELCHIAAHILYGTLKHDWAWRRCMIMCGYAPERCAKLDRKILDQLRNKVERVEATCSCTTHLISKKMATQIRRGRGRVCRRCRSSIKLESVVDILNSLK